MCVCVCVKAKESWEMDPPEKLEQSEISKNKGTDYFKVCSPRLSLAGFGGVQGVVNSILISEH